MEDLDCMMRFMVLFVVLSVVMRGSDISRKLLQKKSCLFDGVLRMSGLASIGGLFEQQPVGAILGVCGGLVFDIRHAAFLAVAAQQLHYAVAVLAAKLGIAVGKRSGDGFYLPERLIASAFFHATAFHFALVDFFAFDCHFFPVPSNVMRSSIPV